jgi:methyl-accepting chemotaxis protein
MEKGKVFRRSYVVKRRLQWKIFAYIIIMLFSFTLFLGLSLYSPLLSILYSNLPPENATLQEAAHLFLSIEKYIWLSIGAVMALIGFYSIVLSHKIAGPIYRFERTLQEVGQGNLSLRIHLRKHDELQELGAEFNRALAFLDGQMQKANQAVEEVERAQAALVALCGSQVPQSEEIQRRVSALEVEISRLREALSIFRLTASPSPENPPTLTQ